MKSKFWLLLILIIVAACSLCMGRYGSSISEIWNALLLSGDEITKSLVWNLRLPRILLVCISGAALAISGVVYQTIFQNPLASGDVIGASSGCSLGATFAILMFSNAWATELSSFIGGMIIVLLTFFLASHVRGNRILNLVVAGLVLQAVANALMMMLKLYADPLTQLAEIEYWLMGGFSDASWESVIITMILCTVGGLGLYLLRWQIQLLSFGEETSTLGVSVKTIRWVSLLLATLLVASVISVAGIVSWVSLLIPHVIRIAYKQPISKTMGITAISGAIFLLVCDTLARTLLTIEIPISILTSLFGGIALIVLFLKGRVRL